MNPSKARFLFQETRLFSSPPARHLSSLFGTVLGFFWYDEGILDPGPTRAGIFINIVR